MPAHAGRRGVPARRIPPHAVSGKRDVPPSLNTRVDCQQPIGGCQVPVAELGSVLDLLLLPCRLLVTRGSAPHQASPSTRTRLSGVQLRCRDDDARVSFVADLFHGEEVVSVSAGDGDVDVVDGGRREVGAVVRVSGVLRDRVAVESRGRGVIGVVVEACGGRAAGGVRSMATLAMARAIQVTDSRRGVPE